ncbi:sulfite exporter TauE/SafE family protein [Fervidibacter sacchari]|uniref:Probable membrane transporter protein n=1 Tax=Candidatus Fervidibacter sacchari TaxID=1448929 RepID=A0ABT2EIB7_9BACT|nr:sulfite exporter TauE/SafE family protein [Candidatus Fervidibacter sacchari]MCS3917667.1 putative membrane protein YfcA [Candidatus Fervidibacter sacchari]WKU15497.1 sulfite exporter TauE/SafE family protein [Candidatus Fervidibacter sacchari]
MTQWVLLHLGAAIVGLGKTGFGGGVGILSTPLFALALGGRMAVGVMLPLLLVCDVFVLSLSYYRNSIDKSNIAVLLPSMLVGIALGLPVLGIMPDEVFKKAIGVLALIFAVAQAYKDFCLKVDEPVKPSKGLGVLLGIGAGFASAIAHVGGTLTTMYLLPQKLPNAVFVGTSTLLYFVSNASKVLPYWKMGLITKQGLWLGVSLLSSVAAGALLGIWLNKVLSPQTFSKLILLLVALTAVRLLVG